MLLSQAVIEAVTTWERNDPNPVSAAFVKDLLEKAAKQQDGESIRHLVNLFPTDNSRISFGTAGLRAEMKPGPLGINDLTIVQTAQGLARYCLKNQTSSNEGGEKLRVVVGYDHRSNPALQISSLSFAILTALVFAEAGMECVLLDGYVFTPLVPFSLKTLGAAAGVMITASHNPAQDNGYKVYASDACQIRAPMDNDISAEIAANLETWTDYRNLIEERKQQYTDDPCLGLSSPSTTRKMLEEYFLALANSGLKTGQSTMEQLSVSLSPPPTFAYTAMHGIGYPFAFRVFEVFQLPPFKPVPEQKDPDFTFRTVPFPNPEEKGALDLAKKFAEENNCDIVLANDPDADRLAVAERDRTTGEWTVFHGDQIGTMLGVWIWNQIGKSSKKPVSMCASTVSSKMLAEVARVEGFHFEDTLTGFKWIGSRSSALNSNGYRHLFGYEEAIGFACGDVIFDKDGVSAMAVFSEMSIWAYRNGLNLKQHMQSLYDKYGEFVSHNGYYFMENNGVVPKIMERIRSNGNYDIPLSPYQVESIRDLDVPGYDSTTPDKKPTLPTSKSAPMMTLRFTNGCIIQLRPSGTEPKFKFYIEMKGNPGVSRDVVAKELKTMAEFVLEKLLEPTKNGLRISL